LSSGARVLHAIEGRLRIKVHAIKDDPARATAICRSIRSIPGVRAARANPVTGSITITYDEVAITGDVVLGKVEQVVGCSLVWVPSSTPQTPSVLSDAGQQIAQALLQRAMETVLQRAILALI